MGVPSCGHSSILFGISWIIFMLGGAMIAVYYADVTTKSNYSNIKQDMSNKSISSSIVHPNSSFENSYIVLSKYTYGILIFITIHSRFNNSQSTILIYDNNINSSNNNSLICKWKGNITSNHKCDFIETCLFPTAQTSMPNILNINSTLSITINYNKCSLPSLNETCDNNIYITANVWWLQFKQMLNNFTYLISFGDNSTNQRVDGYRTHYFYYYPSDNTINLEFVYQFNKIEDICNTFNITSCIIISETSNFSINPNSIISRKCKKSIFIDGNLINYKETKIDIKLDSSNWIQNENMYIGVNIQDSNQNDEIWKKASAIISVKVTYRNQPSWFLNGGIIIVIMGMIAVMASLIYRNLYKKRPHYRVVLLQNK